MLFSPRISSIPSIATRNLVFFSSAHVPELVRPVKYNKELIYADISLEQALSTDSGVEYMQALIGRRDEPKKIREVFEHILKRSAENYIGVKADRSIDRARRPESAIVLIATLPWISIYPMYMETKGVALKADVHVD
jgi:hypothetical protein